MIPCLGLVLLASIGVSVMLCLFLGCPSGFLLLLLIIIIEGPPLLSGVEELPGS